MKRPHNPLIRLELKFNPFNPDIPIESCLLTQRVSHFCGRVERQARRGGFCLIVGRSGEGKSVALRHVEEHMAGNPDVVVGTLSRPQCSQADFYRELGHLFGVKLSPHNRWGGSMALRNRWLEHINSTVFRPLLFVDEAQETKTDVLNELRLLATDKLDSQLLLTVVLCGDERLIEKFRAPALVPLAGRIRARLLLDSLSVEELGKYLEHLLCEAGNAALMTGELRQVMAEHAAGNLRTLMNLGDELIEFAIDRDLKQLDEQHYLAMVGQQQAAALPKKASASRRKAR